MATAYVNQNRLRHRLWVDGEFYGFWDAGDAEFGGESAEVNDPEYGTEPNGGRQTGAELEMTRPWRRGREAQNYQRLKAKRQIGSVVVTMHELDDYKVEVSPAPVDTMTGILVSVTKPESSAEGDEAAVMTIGLELRP